MTLNGRHSAGHNERHSEKLNATQRNRTQKKRIIGHERGKSIPFSGKKIPRSKMNGQNKQKKDESD